MIVRNFTGETNKQEIHHISLPHPPNPLTYTGHRRDSHLFDIPGQAAVNRWWCFEDMGVSVDRTFIIIITTTNFTARWLFTNTQRTEDMQRFEDYIHSTVRACYV